MKKQPFTLVELLAVTLIITILIVLSERLRSESFELSEDKYSCGRFEKCDICIKYPTISSRQCDFNIDN